MIPRKKILRFPLPFPALLEQAALSRSFPPLPFIELRGPAELQFSNRYKRRILAEVDAARMLGQIEAILLREGLYCAHIFRWQQQLSRQGGRT